MTFIVVALGDQLESLRPLRHRDGVLWTEDGQVAAGRGVRGLVVGVDLSGAGSPRQARAELKQHALRRADQVRRHPGAVHLLIAYRLPAGMSADRFLGGADAVALQVHALLERAAARYVDVTLLDVTDCDDGALLADRILERIAGRAGAYSSVALTWSDIRAMSIARATMADYY